jgi:uncharacterized protein YbjT (DUF2867 family)
VKIAIAGGSGTVGRYVVESVTKSGHEAVTLSRSSGFDLISGEGLADALADVEVIIDVSNPFTKNGAKASLFFTTVTKNLHAAGSQAGVQRLVSLSIVVIDNFPFGYYEAKLAQEEAVFAGPLSANVVRATQFHEFAAQILHRTKRGPFAGMPMMRVQPIAARSVGQALCDAALSPPSQKTTEIAGPKVESLVTMSRTIMRERGSRAIVIPIRVPGAAGKMMRGGGQLPSSGAQLVGPTFVDWLLTTDANYPPL